MRKKVPKKLIQKNKVFLMCVKGNALNTIVIKKRSNHLARPFLAFCCDLFVIFRSTCCYRLCLSLRFFLYRRFNFNCCWFISFCILWLLNLCILWLIGLLWILISLLSRINLVSCLNVGSYRWNRWTVCICRISICCIACIVRAYLGICRIKSFYNRSVVR